MFKDETIDAIYRILTRLESAQDEDRFDHKEIFHEAIGISEKRWLGIIEMMLQEGLIEGISVRRGADGYAMISVFDPRITLKGIHYRNDNTLISKLLRGGKQLKDIIPGL